MSRKRKKDKGARGNKQAGQGTIPLVQAAAGGTSGASAAVAAASCGNGGRVSVEATAGPGEREAREASPPRDDDGRGQAGADKQLMVPAALLREAEAKRDEYLTLARKTQAELENYRKRMQRDLAGLKRERLADFLQKLFAPFDDLDRVLAEGEKRQDFEVFRQGVRLARDNLWKVMDGAGVKPIPAQGREFDPRLHEAMTVVPSTEHPPNIVIEVFRQGYMIDDLVLQPARVIVSAAPEDGAPPSSSEQDDKQGDV